MPFIDVNNVKYYYEDSGSGDEVILFSHGFLWSCRMFDEQVKFLTAHGYRVITYDHRGQGKTELVKDGYDMDTLTLDAVQLMEKLNLPAVHFAGLSMGGFIGIRLASRYPEKITSLILLETSPDPEPVENIKKYKRMNFVARWFGLRLVAGPVMKILFGKSFFDPANKKLQKKWKKELLKNRRKGVSKALSGIVGRPSVYEEFPKIKCPTLIIIGEEDIATPLKKANKMYRSLSKGSISLIPKAGHSSTIEQPDLVNKELIHFLSFF